MTSALFVFFDLVTAMLATAAEEGCSIRMLWSYGVLPPLLVIMYCTAMCHDDSLWYDAAASNTQHTRQDLCCLVGVLRHAGPQPAARLPTDA
jgi:hypothetical protein